MKRRKQCKQWKLGKQCKHFIVRCYFYVRWYWGAKDFDSKESRGSKTTGQVQRVNRFLENNTLFLLIRLSKKSQIKFHQWKSWFTSSSFSLPPPLSLPHTQLCFSTRSATVWLENLLCFFSIFNVGFRISQCAHSTFSQGGPCLHGLIRKLAFFSLSMNVSMCAFNIYSKWVPVCLS